MSTPPSGIRTASLQPRVLIVDDHQDSAELLGFLVEQLGCVVRTLFDPREALPAALAFVPHLAFIDIGMPGLNGFEVLASLRAAPVLAGCRFICVTGYRVSEAKAQSAAHGFHALLTKPVDVATLYELTQRELATRLPLAAC